MDPFAREIAKEGPWTIFEDSSCNEPEVRALLYFAIHEDTGEARNIDVTGRHHQDAKFLRAMVAAGCPDRHEVASVLGHAIGPVRPEHLARYSAAHRMEAAQ